MKNFSFSSWCHCFRRLAGAIIENPALTLGPTLRNHQPGLDGLSQANLVGQQSPFGQRRSERK